MRIFLFLLLIFAIYFTVQQWRETHNSCADCQQKWAAIKSYWEV